MKKKTNQKGGRKNLIEKLLNVKKFRQWKIAFSVHSSDEESLKDFFANVTCDEINIIGYSNISRWYLRKKFVLADLKRRIRNSTHYSLSRNEVDKDEGEVRV